MTRALRNIALLLGVLLCTAAPAGAASRWFTTSDGVRLHYIEQGTGRTIVMVPGWTMPAWIFQAQIADFARTWRVLALDPRGQGESDVPASGYEPGRRGQDIAELIQAAGGTAPVVLMGWSLGVLDALAYVHEHGDGRIAGLVLIDNSVGEEPAPAPDRTGTARGPRRTRHARPVGREESMRAFVRSMFRVPPSTDYVDRLTEATLRTPAWAARALLSYPVPRSYWREAIYSTDKPVLYVVRPTLAGQASNLELHHPGADSVVMQGVGHAMFVDDPAGFNATVAAFLHRRVWS